MRRHAAPNVPCGRVIVIEDGEVVADGRLADLVRTDGEDAENVDIYVKPDDAEAFRARWFECKAEKRRLN
jgi:ABC-type multidrug transport system ATPase subunit